MSDGLRIRFSLHARPGDIPYAPSEGRLPHVTRALAMAIRIEHDIRTGEASDYADVARLRGVSRERVSQFARLNFLAPDIQVEILYLPPTETGRHPISEAAVRRVANLLSWAEQRREWAQLKRSHRLK